MDKVKNVVEEDRKRSLMDLSRETGLSRSTCRRIAAGDLGLKSITQVRSQRVAKAEEKRRKETCSKWIDQMDANYAEFDPRKVYRGDEKYCRIG